MCAVALPHDPGFVGHTEDLHDLPADQRRRTQTAVLSNQNKHHLWLRDHNTKSEIFRHCFPKEHGSNASRLLGIVLSCDQSDVLDRQTPVRYRSVQHLLRSSHDFAGDS